MLSNMLALLTTMQVNYINPIGLQNISWRYYIIQTIFVAVLLVIIWFTFVETKGLTLEEIAIKFDGGEEFDTAVAVQSFETKGVEDEVVRIEKTA
jgi:hypothetical protein